MDATAAARSAAQLELDQLDAEIAELEGKLEVKRKLRDLARKLTAHGRSRGGQRADGLPPGLRQGRAPFKALELLRDALPNTMTVEEAGDASGETAGKSRTDKFRNALKKLVDLDLAELVEDGVYRAKQGEDAGQ